MMILSLRCHHCITCVYYKNKEKLFC